MTTVAPMDEFAGAIEGDTVAACLAAHARHEPTRVSIKEHLLNLL